MKVEIVSEAGVPVFDVTSRGSVFDWSMKGGDGEAVADGTYVCVITLKSVGGKLSQRVGTISFAGGKASMSSEARLTAGQEGAVGPVEEGSTIAVMSEEVPSTTVVGHDGKDGQVTSTTGDLTFKTGDVFSGTETERMRIKADGNIDVRGTIQSQGGYGFMNGTKLTVDDNGGLRVTRKDGTTSAPNVAGTGTQNRLAKWLETGGAGTLGDSLVFENGGFMGINTSSPGNLNGVQFATVPLHLNRIGNSAYMAVDAEGAGSFAGVLLNRNSASANNRMWVMDSQPAPGSSSLLAFSTYSDAGTPTARMAVTRAGDVGIATTTPQYRLDVQHSGSTGIRSQSSASFSVVDIDASSGDAALRFQKAGAGKWNTRNNPANDNYQIFQLGGGGSRIEINSTTGGITQPTATSGLVKAGAAVVGGATPSIARQFNNLPSGAAITITRLGIGTYEINFGDDITSRFYIASPGGPTFGSTTGQISIAQRSGNANALFVVASDSAGAASDSVNFNIVVY